jgi:hypothetical protein
LLPPPKIESRWTCIAHYEATALAAQLSSYFNEPGVYFPVFLFPGVGQAFQEVPSRDGYFGQVIGKRAAIHINNCLAQIQPDFTILLGLSDDAQSYIRAVLPAEKLIVINTEEELLKLPFAAGAGEPIKCKPAEAIHGLIAAKRERRPLAFDDRAPALPAKQIVGASGLMVVENEFEVSEVAIANYAASIGADVVIVEQIARQEIQNLPRQIQAWSKDRSSPALKDLRRKVTDRVKDIDFTRYEFATFFTTGLPYGLILQNVIPFTHVLNGPYCGLVIANAIMAENAPPLIGSAVMFAIEEFAQDETPEVAELLDANNFLVTPLVGPNATNANLNDFGTYFPYDLLHISSHGGETDGYFVKHAFKDRNGKDHTLEYFEVVSFSLEAAVDPDNVKCESKMIFVALDGISWADRPLSLCPNYVGDDMMQALRDDEHVKRTPVSVPIALSCHIQCYQSIHQGMFDFVGAFATPIIFNNSCSSSHELASSILAAGARSYLATLWNVGSKTATQAAITFYKTLLTDGGILKAFSAMLASITNKRYKDIYILWGLHFTTLRWPTKKSEHNIIEGLLHFFAMYRRRLQATQDEQLRRNLIPPLRFLIGALLARLPKNVLDELRASQQLPEEEEVERSYVLDQQGDISELTVHEDFVRAKARRS